MMSLYFAKNFKYAEIMCPCGCGKVRPIDPKLTYLLQLLRDKINKPIYINKGGGLRCKGYNKKIGGYKHSPHVPYYITIDKKRRLIGCRATDIHAKNMDIITLAKHAKEVGFTRIGLYPYNHFIHVDVLKPRPSRAWLRDGDGIYYYFTTLEDAISVL